MSLFEGILIFIIIAQFLILVIMNSNTNMLLKKLSEAAEIIRSSQHIISQQNGIVELMQNLGDSVDKHLGGENTVADIQAYINKATMERIDLEKNKK